MKNSVKIVGVLAIIAAYLYWKNYQKNKSTTSVDNKTGSGASTTSTSLTTPNAVTPKAGGSVISPNPIGIVSSKEAEQVRMIEKARIEEQSLLASLLEKAKLAELGERARLAKLITDVEEKKLAEVAIFKERARLAEIAMLAEKAKLAEKARLAQLIIDEEQRRLVQQAILTEQALLAEKERRAEVVRKEQLLTLTVQASRPNMFR
jgi:hypothetical protein